MLNVKTPVEVIDILINEFSPIKEKETVPLIEATGRVLAESLKSEEFLPEFDRSTMDGYALFAEDTFGCSDALPALLNLQGKIEMGKMPEEAIKKGCCFAIPTGGALPFGANGVAMVENSEDFGDGTIGITKSVAPGSNIIFKGDDLKPGQVVLEAGRRLKAADIGSFAALGLQEIEVRRKIKVGIISTGDELVEPSEAPEMGQIRDVNTSLLSAMVLEAGCTPVNFGIIKDDKDLLKEKIAEAIKNCDTLLISGGSSAGEKDHTAKLFSEMGELLLHGIAMKPGKPTMLGKIDGKAVFGLAGHPGAAYFTALVFVKPFLKYLMGEKSEIHKEIAILTETVSSNHGRTQYLPVKLYIKDNKLYAKPIISKSGLITDCAGIDAYMIIERDQEGLKEGNLIEVYHVI